LGPQDQKAERKQRMNNCKSLPGDLAALPPTNTVASQQHEDHFEKKCQEKDLLLHEAKDDEIHQQLVAIGQRLDAAVATAELAAPALLDLSRCEASVTALLSARSSPNALQLRALRSSPRFAPQRRALPEPGSPGGLPIPATILLTGSSEGSEQCQKSASTSTGSTADKTSPRWQLQCKASATQSLADILEQRRRSCEGLPPPPPEIVPDSPGVRE